MRESYRYSVHLRCLERPELSPVFTSVHEIPERLVEYDPSLFIAYDNKNNRFEVHSLHDRSVIGGTTLPFSTLDARTVTYVKQHDIRRRGREIFREIDENHAKMERARQRKFHNWVEDVASESRSMFAKSSLGLDDMKTFHGGGWNGNARRTDETA